MRPVARKIQEKLPQAFIGSKEFLGELTVLVKKEEIVGICQFLHDDPALSFDHITDICSVDYPQAEERFEVVYQVYSITHRHRIRVKARVREDDPVIDSVTGIWKGANFLEREVYDMMGIRFRGHPDLRRILMPEDYEEGYPLRKDFPVEGKGWRGTFDFLHQEK